MHHRPGGASRPHMTKKTCPAAPQKGFLPGDAQPIADKVNDADERLFRAITTDPSHVLRQLLPKPKHTGYVLRPDHMATSSLRRTNATSYLVCYIKTFIVQYDRGPRAIHWWA